MGQRWTLDTKHKINAFVEFVMGKLETGDPQTVEFIKPGRTTQQNTMFYALYRDIAEQKSDQSLLDIRKECKLHYGIKILKAKDPEFCDWYDKNVKPWPYEAKLTLMEHLDVTSKFDKDEGTEYINTILTEYQKQGLYLAHEA